MSTKPETSRNKFVQHCVMEPNSMTMHNVVAYLSTLLLWAVVYRFLALPTTYRFVTESSWVSTAFLFCCPRVKEF